MKTFTQFLKESVTIKPEDRQAFMKARAAIKNNRGKNASEVGKAQGIIDKLMKKYPKAELEDFLP